MPNKEILARYAAIKLQLSQLEAEAEMLKPEALMTVKEIRGDVDAPVQLKEYPGFSFTITKRKVWTYPPFILDDEKKLKENKKNAEANGEAEFTEKESLMFVGPRDKNENI